MQFITKVLLNMPKEWLKLTTHRLDIYEEKLAKTQFLEQFEKLFSQNNVSPSALAELPTAYDYIRLGHPLSCVMEWCIARTHRLKAKNVISFSSSTIPLMAVLRKNAQDHKKTQILYNQELPGSFNADLLQSVYGYQFELKKVEGPSQITDFDGSTIWVGSSDNLAAVELHSAIDFYVNIQASYGSILLINGPDDESYIPAVQHVRRRETIAMTPANCLDLLNRMTDSSCEASKYDANNKVKVQNAIKEITGTSAKPLVASSGLSIQYAIMMGLIDDAMEKYPGKDIKFIVPTNCYGGTNDQARRVAACIDQVEVVDLAVDGENDMVQSIDAVLDQMAAIDVVPFIIAEIPTNPRVEVPDLQKLREVLSKERKTAQGVTATDPVFILDQTFCPNIHFLGGNEILSSVKALSYASGSKFPSGGLCTAGYCVANEKAKYLVEKMDTHLKLCDNEATDLQMEILAMQLPSMKQRIQDAYQNTREFVDYIHKTLPGAKINFVSEDLAELGFTPSVFSLDLPTKGNTDDEKEAYKRALNHKLINRMITEIPHESKYCVSYGQLKGCYWTIPATSTQGTTKEGDKDYIARVALSGNMDLEMHKKVFLDFVEEI